MNTIKINVQNKKIVAHRGASRLEKENTLAAFIAAGNRSYYGIECDIHRTADGRYVVIHDETTKRVAGDSVDVENSSFHLVRSVVLDDIDGTKRKDLFPPTLEEYLKLCVKYEKTAVIELKGAFEKPWIKEVLDILYARGDSENTVFISFYADNLIMLREWAPRQKAQLLTDKWSDDLIPLLKKHRLDLDILYSALDKQRIDDAHNNGISVNCWTVDDPTVAEQLLSWGVDYITSNCLE